MHILLISSLIAIVIYDQVSKIKARLSYIENRKVRSNLKTKLIVDAANDYLSSNQKLDLIV